MPELPIVNDAVGKRRVQYWIQPDNFPKGYEEMRKKHQGRYSQGQNSRYQYKC